MPRITSFPGVGGGAGGPGVGGGVGGPGVGAGVGGDGDVQSMIFPRGQLWKCFEADGHVDPSWQH